MTRKRKKESTNHITSIPTISAITITAIRGAISHKFEARVLPYWIWAALVENGSLNIESEYRFATGFWIGARYSNWKRNLKNQSV